MAYATWHAPLDRPELSITLPGSAARLCGPWEWITTRRPGADMAEARDVFEPGTGPRVRVGMIPANLCVCLPPMVPRRVPGAAAMILAAMRERPDVWIEIRLERGEWAEIVALSGGLRQWRRQARTQRFPGDPTDRRAWWWWARAIVARRRRHRHLRRLRLEAADFLTVLSPHLREAIRRAGARRTVDVSNSLGPGPEMEPGWWEHPDEEETPTP